MFRLLGNARRSLQVWVAKELKESEINMYEYRYTEIEVEEANWPCRMCNNKNPSKGSPRFEDCELCKAMGQTDDRHPLAKESKPLKFELCQNYLIISRQSGEPGWIWEQLRDMQDEKDRNGKFDLSLEDIEIILKSLRVELRQTINIIGVKDILVGITGPANFSNNFIERVHFLLPVKILEDGDISFEEPLVKILTKQIIDKLTIDHSGKNRILQSHLKLDSSKILEVFLKNEIDGECYSDCTVPMVCYKVWVGFKVSDR